MAVRRRKHVTTKDRSADRFDPAFLDDERHHEALEKLAVQAMSSGNFRDAFKYADRRCRVYPLAQAYHYVLRAETSYQMDERRAAIDDISRALELLPEDLAANRRMLAWAEGARQLQAAQVLVRCEQDFKVLAKAVSLLRKGRKRTAFGAIRCTDTEIFGWASWPGRSLPKLRIEGDTTVIETLAADPRHARGRRAAMPRHFRDRDHGPMRRRPCPFPWVRSRFANCGFRQAGMWSLPPRAFPRNKATI